MTTLPGRKHRLILCNDGGSLAGPTLEAPIGADGLEALTIAPLRGTHIDTLYWQLGTDPFLGYFNSRLSDTYSHETTIGPRWGTGRKTFPSAGTWRIYENTRQMQDEGLDPPAVVIERGRRAGLSVFLSMRFNDMHDGRLGDPAHPLLSRMKREHPDWLLGLSANPWEGSRNFGFSRFAYNYAVPEVRRYKTALAKETIANYDLDGLDLDFVRFPRVFPKGTGREKADLITGMLKDLREALDEKGKRVGRRLELSVRLPPTPELALAFGYDVETWVREEIVDIIIAGVVQGDCHRLPVEGFLKMTEGRETMVIAQAPGYYHGHRPYSARVLFHEKPYKSPEMIRASALAYWKAGVDGLYLWNHHLIPFALDAGFDPVSWREIGDPGAIAGSDKHYVLDDARISSGMDGEQENPTAQGLPVPRKLSRPGDSTSIPIEIADDITDGTGWRATLRIMIDQITSLDRIDLLLNDQVLNLDCATKRLLYNHCWIDIDCRDGLRHGSNLLTLKLAQRNPAVEPALSIESVEVLITYPDTRS